MKPEKPKSRVTAGKRGNQTLTVYLSLKKNGLSEHCGHIYSIINFPQFEEFIDFCFTQMSS
jgi:hypothetical protein